MSGPIRVLHVITGMGSGGAESFIMNFYRHMDYDKVQFDFLLCSDENIYEDELKKTGSQIFKVPKYTRHFIKNAKQTKEFLDTHEYQIIHVHANSLMHIAPLIEAKQRKIPCRIMHSHSTFLKYKSFILLHWLHKRLINHWATDCFACSVAAGKWMFPGRFKVIHNAIDINRFVFNDSIRSSVRRELGVSDDVFIIGHIGKFLKVKNHSFIVQLFNEIIKKKSNSMLLLVGEGVLEEKIHTQVKKLGLDDKVRFLGVRSDIHNIINAFDIFILPSLYEGLGIVAIEAQANGLSVICSDNVPHDVEVTNNIQFLSLRLGAKEWANRIIKTSSDRKVTSQELFNAGYDIHLEAKKLQDFYISNVE